MTNPTRTARTNPSIPSSEDAARHLNPLDMTLMEKHRQCPATSKRTGRRCKNMCPLAMKTCRLHGSGTMRAKVAAAERIRAAAGYAAALLVELMADPAVDVKLRADLARDVLTRAGIEEARKVQIDATIEAPWQKLLRDGGVFKVVHTGGQVPAASAVDPAAAARAVGKEIEMGGRAAEAVAVVPPSDSSAARATYQANKNAPDPMPLNAVQRVDGTRPAMRRRKTS